MDPTQQANNNANEETTGASAVNILNQIHTTIQAMIDGFVSRFDRLLNATQEVLGKLKAVMVCILEAGTELAITKMTF